MFRFTQHDNVSMRSLLSGGFQWFRSTRFKWLLLTVLLCLGVRENYPFSNFPMYSRFANHTYFLYLTNRQGRPVATPRYGLSTTTLDKIFDRYRRSELKKLQNAGPERDRLSQERAAESLLHYLDGLAAAHPRSRKLLRGVQVNYGRVYQESGALRLETRTLARHP